MQLGMTICIGNLKINCSLGSFTPPQPAWIRLEQYFFSGVGVSAPPQTTEHDLMRYLNQHIGKSG